MIEPVPRKNCPACGATACFAPECEPEAIARADTFAALAPAEFFVGPIPQVGKSWRWVLNAWVSKQSARVVVHLAMHKYPRMKYAFDAGDFTGWPELDAALRLGGYEAMLDVVATMIPEPKS